MLQRNILVGRDSLFEYLDEWELLIKPRKNYHKTTNSYHRFKKYTNLIKNIVPTRPYEILVSDITYIPTREGYCYLSLITDKYSRKIVGYELSYSLNIEGCLKALKKALANRPDKNKPLIHHSDRGIQYCSNEYVELLVKENIQISMTEKEHVYENALAERVNGILKMEYIGFDILPSIKIAKELVDEAIYLYNNERLHMSLSYKTPNEVFLEAYSA